jgi:ribosomal protein S18 acetylase RimI-like enzyme
MTVAPNDGQPEAPVRTAVRLRKMLDGDIATRHFPAGFSLRTFEASDAPALHALLAVCFDDGTDGPFDEWWPSRSADPEFDPSLIFLVHHADGQLAGTAFCWARNFIRDFAVHPRHRRLGIGEALLLAAFAAFRARGATHVDLKTEPADSPAALRLYRRLGMFEVAWEG